MKCPLCKEDVGPVDDVAPYMWLESYGDSCRVRLTCGHYVRLYKITSYRVVEEDNQYDVDDWGN